MPTQPASTPCPKRRDAECRGRAAESAVAARWRSKGFSVLAQRLRTGLGEIDLIVADKDILVFVEVKARTSLTAAAHAVPPRQQVRLLNAAELALAVHQDWHRPAIRFDVALVCGNTVHDIEDAIRYN